MLPLISVYQLDSLLAQTIDLDDLNDLAFAPSADLFPPVSFSFLPSYSDSSLVHSQPAYLPCSQSQQTIAQVTRAMTSSLQKAKLTGEAISLQNIISLDDGHLRDHIKRIVGKDNDTSPKATPQGIELVDGTMIPIDAVTLADWQDVMGTDE